MRWRQLCLHLDAAQAAHAEALLHLAGAAAVSIVDDADSPLLEPEVGATPLWPSVRVKALFPSETDLERLARLLERSLENRAPPSIEPLADEDWIAAWRQRVRRSRFGRLRILPAEDAIPDDASAAVALHMGLAFGTGDHPTTALCLEWLGAHDLSGLDVVDYGTGSGILALAALKLGAAAAWGTDIEPQALEAARDNARLNGLEHAFRLVSPDSLPLELQVDVVIANIVAGPLVALAPRFAALSRAGSRIVLSGILERQIDEVECAYAPDYERFEVASRDGWVRVAAERKSAT